VLLPDNATPIQPRTGATMGQVEDTCKKWSQGRRLGGAGAFGDFSDYPPARTTATLLLI
jgi:hypothetical protein